MFRKRYDRIDAGPRGGLFYDNSLMLSLSQSLVEFVSHYFYDCLNYMLWGGTSRRVGLRRMMEDLQPSALQALPPAPLF